MNNQNRRNFLKAGTTLGASLLATSAFSFSQSNRKGTPIKEAEKNPPSIKRCYVLYNMLEWIGVLSRTVAGQQTKRIISNAANNAIQSQN